MPTNFVMPVEMHNALVAAAYRKRGFSDDEARAGARVAQLASWHGIKTHNAIKALHLDDFLGSKVGGCTPNATIEKLPSKFKAVQRWNANRKLGQAVALEAMDVCRGLADEFGVGAVAVDNAFHYLWGGGYVIDAANKGYIAYTNCTAGLAEVVPFMGRFPTIGTNPHSWGFPTTDAIGFPICVDWATSVIAAGRVQQLLREGKPLPPQAAVDAEGNFTTDPNKVSALVPFGGHKGYGLALIDELYGAYIGGSLPTIRNRWEHVGARPGEKGTCTFFFQCIRPEAISGEDFAQRRTQAENVKEVIGEILSHGNEKCLLPGEPEAVAARLSQEQGGLIFTPIEIDNFEAIAKEAGAPFDRAAMKRIEL
jgi:L-2-hydroxycarboxylate dehydrogenase (NAD+)